MLAGTTVLVTHVALRAQATAALFVYGESRWSKGRSETVAGLFRFAESGAEADLDRARRGLNVPLSDLRGRLALEAEPPDREAAVAAWVDSGHTPRDANAMVDFFQRFGATRFFEPSVTAWRATDGYLAEFDELADLMEAEHARETPDTSRLLQARVRAVELGDRIRPLERSFSRSLADAVHWLRNLLLVATTGTFVALVFVSTAVIGWAYRAVRERDEALRRTFAQATVGMAHLDAEGRFTEVNAALARLFGRPERELLGRSLTEFVQPDDVPDGGIGAKPSDSKPGPREWRLRLDDGTSPWIRSTFSHVRLGSHAGHRRFATFEDVSEARRLTEELEHRARHDALTGLLNRYAFDRRLSAAIASARRSGRSHAAAFVDLDQFKVVNDTSGHAAGDALLVRVGAILRELLRENDEIARMGGDEFALLLEDSDLNAAHDVAEKIRRRLAREEFVWEERRFRTTASVGVTEVRAEDGDPGTVLRRADVACYLAKEAGRDRVHVYAAGDEASTRVHSEMEWVGRIREALRDDRLVVFAQRIVPLTGNAGQRYELLLRLRDEDGTLHPPGVFLPAAERYGVIGELDRWVARRALSTLERHPEHLRTLEAVHLNVSAASVSDPGFATDLIELLDRHAVPADRICVEITETAAMRDLGQSRRFLAALRERGVRIALDDFGSGLSSFAYLKSLPIDLVKIDGMLVRDVAVDPLDRTLVRSVHELARVLGKRTVAEFVENDSIADVLREIRIDLAQGFGLHRPQPWTELLEAPSDDGPRTSES